MISATDRWKADIKNHIEKLMDKKDAYYEDLRVVSKINGEGRYFQDADGGRRVNYSYLILKDRIKEVHDQIILNVNLYNKICKKKEYISI